MASTEGRKRRDWPIRGFLREEGHTMSSLARQIGVSPQQVRNTINGDDDSPRVLKALIAMGCPLNILSLPKHLKAEVQLG